ncbi:peptidoglycan-binding protein [Streptomyces sp. NPDC001691]|uniref:peptidoglycan-binding domain-containing protein n=1 Tax=Streptomyces sp. NPDC001691 TaxID=3364600 RepID=UPI0036C9F5F8
MIDGPSPVAVLNQNVTMSVTLDESGRSVTVAEPGPLHIDKKEEAMRPALTRALVSATAVVGIAAGSLAGASASFAAPQPTATPLVSTHDVSILAVNNLGLNTTQAKNWQCWLRDSGYDPGTIDGQLGTNSWMAAQRMFNDLHLGAGTVDGIVGPNTIGALQRYLNSYGYSLAVDGSAGPQTRAAFADFNSTGC